MSRETIFSSEPAKHFESEDLPTRSKHATHLVTYPNFLSSDIDHSQDRPFTNMSPDSKRKAIPRGDFHLDRESLPHDFDKKPTGKKRSVNTNATTCDPLRFNPVYHDPNEKVAIKRMPLKQNSSLIGSNPMPMKAEEKRSYKKKESFKYQDSSQVKSSLTFI